MMRLGLYFIALLVCRAEGAQIEFSNQCGFDIWINPLTNAQGPVLDPGIVRIGNSDSFAYQIPGGGWFVKPMKFQTIEGDH